MVTLKRRRLTRQLVLNRRGVGLMEDEERREGRVEEGVEAVRREEFMAPTASVVGEAQQRCEK